jgi:hypothetical protein
MLKSYQKLCHIWRQKFIVITNFNIMRPEVNLIEAVRGMQNYCTLNCFMFYYKNNIKLVFFLIIPYQSWFDFLLFLKVVEQST